MQICYLNVICIVVLSGSHDAPTGLLPPKPPRESTIGSLVATIPATLVTLVADHRATSKPSQPRNRLPLSSVEVTVPCTFQEASDTAPPPAPGLLWEQKHWKQVLGYEGGGVACACKADFN